MTWLKEDPGRVNSVLTVLRYSGELHRCIEEGTCLSSSVCAKTWEEIDNFLVSFSSYIDMIQNDYCAPQILDRRCSGLLMLLESAMA